MWDPPTDLIGDNEIIGRHIFGDRLWEGELSQGERRRLRVEHFQDSRSEIDLSVDRLGRGNVDRKVMGYVGRLASASGRGRTPPQTFHGWAGLRVKAFRSAFKGVSDIHPKPIDSPPNPFHAEISRAQFRSKVHAYTLAVTLRELA